MKEILPAAFLAAAAAAAFAGAQYGRSSMEQQLASCQGQLGLKRETSVQKTETRTSTLPASSPPLSAHPGEAPQVFSSDPAPGSPSQAGLPEDKDPRQSNAAAQARLLTIRKFVSLTPEQEQQLLWELSKEGSNASSEAVLGRVLGADAAAFYQEARRRAFERSELREVEKETLYLSRRLSMSSEQEDRVRNALIAVEQEMREPVSAGGAHGPDAAGAMQRLLQQARRESELTRENLMRILTAEQYSQYLEMEAESEAADLELWHGGQ